MITQIAIGGAVSSVPSDLALWQQVLHGQQAMIQQLEHLNSRQHRMEYWQRCMSHKINHFIERSGYQIDSPLPSPQQD